MYVEKKMIGPIPGLPDGTFSFQKYQFECIWNILQQFDIFVHLVVLWSFDVFPSPILVFFTTKNLATLLDPLCTVTSVILSIPGRKRLILSQRTLPMVSLPFSLMMFRSHPSSGTSFSLVI
jgi:hypothetical protein